MFLVRITWTKVCTTVHADEGENVKCMYRCGSVQVSGVQMGCVDVGCTSEDMQSGVCTQGNFLQIFRRKEELSNIGTTFCSNMRARHCRPY